MKKLSTVLMLFMAIIGLNAQVWTENFTNHTVGGDLEGTNGWYVSKKGSEAMGESPVIVEEPLVYAIPNYPEYPGSGVGHSVKLDPLMGDTDATKRLSTNKMQIGGNDVINADGQTIYAAFLVSIMDESKTSARDFFTFEGSDGSNFSRGRVFVENKGDNTFWLGVGKNTSSKASIGWITDPQDTSAEPDTMAFPIGQPILIAIAYEGVEGDNNDVIHVYAYPNGSEAEDSQVYHAVSYDEQTDYGSSNILGINLRQRAVGAIISGIRVGYNWGEVLTGTPTSINKVAVPSVSNFAFGGENSITVTEIGTIEIYNLAGSQVYSGASNGQSTITLAKGVYVVKLSTPFGSVSSEKVVVK